MFSRSSLLAITWVVLAVTLASATAGARDAELLTIAQMRGITGADVANCDSRFYEYTCINLDSKNNPGACLGKAAKDCTGDCNYCDGGITMQFCDMTAPLNAIGCTITIDPSMNCGVEWTNICHMYNASCSCYGGTGATKTGNNCKNLQTATYTRPCTKP